MFSELKTQLGSVETKLQALLETLKGQITGIEAEIGTIDAPLLGAFDRLKGMVMRTRQLVTTRVGAVKREIQQLVPPPG